MAPSRRTNRGILAGTVLLVIVVACIVTAGCTAGTSTPGTAAGLTGVSWSLDTYLADNGTLIPALPKSEVTARFDDDGKVVGSAGCNQYGSDYHLDGTVLSISPPISTKMYCSEPEGLMEQEARFLELLASAAECQIENNRLEIIDASGAPVLTFVKGIPIDLAGTSWTLTSLIDEGGSMAPIVTGTTVTAIFDAGGIRVSGLAGCNHYSADYTRNGADITIKSAVRTDMYCGEPEGLMDQEDRYLSLLTDVSSYWVEGDRLILSDKEGADLLVLDRAAEVPDLPLVGTDWVLDSYSTGRDAISSVITGTTITAKFTDDSKITGSAGCNHYGGEYLLDGANLSVSSLFSTLMYCGEPEGVMEQEARYLGLFDSVTGYRIDGDRLDLLDEVGKVLLSYRAGCTDQP
jgi:heat shock protein HslJ